MQLSRGAAFDGDKLGILLGEDKLKEIVSMAVEILRIVNHRGRLRVYDAHKARYLVAQLLAECGLLDIIPSDPVRIFTRAESVTYILNDQGRKALAELTEKYHE